ncbi:MAG: HNH endonuclease [Candidatus Atribacteria bacterium]|nr:HNH endonuclease [Candidatus Atribacteria bacterium]
MSPRKSISPYPANWPEIASRTKDAAEWKCVRCGHLNDRTTGHMLGVHHLDLDPQNCEWWNIVALCQRCHLRIQSKVVMERPWMFEHSDWFKPYVAGYYAYMHSHPTDRDWVMAHLESLLKYGQPNTTVFLLTHLFEVPVGETASSST